MKYENSGGISIPLDAVMSLSEMLQSDSIGAQTDGETTMMRFTNQQCVLQPAC